MQRTWRAAAILVTALIAATMVPGDAHATRFGRNKVQYGAFTWNVAHTEHFDVYFYDGSEDLADAVSSIIESANAEFEVVLGHELTTVIPVIVYASHNDFRQTNVSDSHIGEGVGGFTELFKNRVVVPFTGSYEDLRHVLYHELTHVFMFDIVYGGLVESVIRQAYTNPVPLWFVEGLAEYVSRGWDSQAEMILRDLTLSDTIVPLQYLWGGYLVYKEGQSAICFIADTYGPEKIEEMVKTVARTHNLERALMDATGFTTVELSKEWERSLKKRYWPEIEGRDRGEDILRLVTDHSKDNSYLNLGPAASPDGLRVAFITDRSGYSDLCVASMLDGTVLSKPVKGERSDDFETLHVLRPGSSWSPDGTALCFVAKAGPTDAIHIVDVESGKLRRSLRFPLDGVFTPSWSPNGDRLAFVGTSRGASDLYLADVDGANLVRLTDDFFDERNPVWSPDGRLIAFASDRNAPVRADLRRSYDLYAIDVATRRVETLVATAANESSPSWSPDGSRMAYVSDSSGSPQLYLADLGDSTSVRVTQLIGGVSSPSWPLGGDRMALAVYGHGGWDIASVKAPLEAFADAIAAGEHTLSIDRAYLRGEVVGGPWSPVPCTVAEERPPAVDDEPEAEVADAVDETATGDAAVETSEDTPADTPAGDGAVADSGSSVAKARAAYRTAVRGQGPHSGVPGPVDDEDDGRRVGSVERYRPRFTPDWVSGGFAYTSGYGFSGAAQIAVSDVLGNHRFYIATNFFSSLESSNFNVLYEHLAHRANFSLGVYNFKDYYYSDRTWLGEYLGEKRYFAERSYGVSAGVSYPFSMFSRVEFDLSAISVYRQYAEENEEGYVELIDEQVARSLVIPSVRFVNDTTLWGSVGPLGGGRSSVVLQRAWETGGDFTYLTGIADMRKYVRIGSRHSLAFKVIAARSSARNAQNFYMGGVNSLRGHDDFEFHGRNLALASIEFRYPFIDHLQIASPIPLSLRGLRGVMFVDAGAAWDDEFRGIVSGPGGHTLNDIKASTGVGVRMQLSMFIIRVDWAWPTDLQSTGGAMTHFALGAEF
ncbi:MAG: BamA/TamA family outer membrane protein [Candidatus Eisenbacteria bacterium]